MQTILSNHARTLTALLLVAMATLVSSCGGSGAPATTATTATATSAAVVQLTENSAQMPSAGNTTVTVTAVVLTAAGQAVSGQAVSFSTNGDPSAYFSSISGSTDANGTVTATLNLGANKSNRNISITATAGTAVGSNSVAVTGSTITISGTSSLTSGGSTTLTFNVKDSAGNPIATPITLTSQAGNTLNPASGTTSGSGLFTTVVTASTTAASDVISVSAAGAAATQNLNINSASFAFTAPVSNVLIPINTSTPISLTWTNGGVGVAASSVNFSASRGTITGAAATTNGSGVATASISSPSTGSTIISAAGPNGTPAASVNVSFYTNTASNISLQANPSTIAVTSGAAGQTSNSSVISVIVRDAANNLVQNAQVNFSDAVDVTGGYLSSSTATTNSSGSASVNYIAGGVSSPQNGVTISATVVSINGTAITPVVGNVYITVSGQSLLIRLGKDNLTASIPPQNQKIFTATVTDAGGNAVVGATVTFKLRPIAYFKGFYTWGSAAWGQTLTATCASEDNGGNINPPLANNGQLDVNIFNTLTNTPTTITEDINGNGFLDPGNGTASVTGSGVTNSTGTATATITFSKDHATWVAFVLEARSSVNSNDPPATAAYTLTGVAGDYSSQTVAPPGVVSPYGVSALCTDSL